MVQLFYLRLFLGTETFFLLSVATDSKGGHGLKKLEKVGSTFSNFNVNAANIIQTNKYHG